MNITNNKNLRITPLFLAFTLFFSPMMQADALSKAFKNVGKKIGKAFEHGFQYHVALINKCENFQVQFKLRHPGRAGDSCKPNYKRLDPGKTAHIRPGLCLTDKVEMKLFKKNGNVWSYFQTLQFDVPERSMGNFGITIREDERFFYIDYITSTDHERAGIVIGALALVAGAVAAGAYGGAAAATVAGEKSIVAATGTSIQILGPSGVVTIKVTTDANLALLTAQGMTITNMGTAQGIVGTSAAQGALAGGAASGAAGAGGALAVMSLPTTTIMESFTKDYRINTYARIKHDPVRINNDLITIIKYNNGKGFLRYLKQVARFVDANTVDKNGANQFMLLARNGWYKNVNLFKNGKNLAKTVSNVNAQDNDGNTALHHSVHSAFNRGGYPLKTIKMLIKLGAKKSITNNRGETAKQMAERMKNESPIKESKAKQKVMNQLIKLL